MHWLKNSPYNSNRGRQFEDIALKYLKQRGLKLLQRNYSSNHGEIDLIMQDRDTLVFVEVRYRKYDHYGSALESVDYQKRARITNTAENYLQTHPWNGPCRFDIVAIQGTEKPQWISAAFDSCSM